MSAVMGLDKSVLAVLNVSSSLSSMRLPLFNVQGPTNSGKTHSAVVAMRDAPSGVYAGPLRLLAMEIYDSLNASGTSCDLVRPLFSLAWLLSPPLLSLPPFFDAPLRVLAMEIYDSLNASGTSCDLVRASSAFSELLMGLPRGIHRAG